MPLLFGLTVIAVWIAGALVCQRIDQAHGRRLARRFAEQRLHRSICELRLDWKGR